MVKTSTSQRRSSKRRISLKAVLLGQRRLQRLRSGQQLRNKQWTTVAVLSTCNLVDLRLQSLIAVWTTERQLTSRCRNWQARYRKGGMVLTTIALPKSNVSLSRCIERPRMSTHRPTLRLPLRSSLVACLSSQPKKIHRQLSRKISHLKAVDTALWVTVQFPKQLWNHLMIQ